MRRLAIALALLSLAACQSNQRLHQGVLWQQDLLALQKSEGDTIIRVLFAEIERAYHLQIDERMTRLLAPDPELGRPKSESQIKKLYSQANSQKLKITKTLNAKRDELLVNPSLDMAIKINSTMAALTGAKANAEAEVNAVIGQERTKLIEQYARKIPDLGRFLPSQ